MNRLIQQRFTDVAEANGHSLMVLDGDRSVTYGEAEIRSNRLARRLVALGCSPGDRIALCLPKCLETFTGLLAILKADAIYVPIDPTIPATRIADILDQCGCNLVCTNRDAAGKLGPALAEAGAGCTLVLLDEEHAPDNAQESTGLPVHATGLLADLPAGPREYDRISDDPAYIVFTSGSTGRPKGVTIPHRAVLDYADWTIQYFHVTTGDRLSSHAGLHFDLSVFDVYTALLSGASLHPVPREASLFPAKFAEFAAERAITIWCSVPSYLTYQAKSGILAKTKLPALRAVTFCGEVMPTATMIEWMTHQPQTRYVNQYGPSETCCASMFYPIDEIPSDPCAAVAIGKAIPNTEVFHVTEDGHRAGPGQRGELCIRGEGNGLGYWADPEKTAAAFIQNPLHDDYPDTVYATGDIVVLREDGVYEFVERKDHQIKYMGYRVELGEIETVLTGLDAVRQAAVVAVSSDTAQTSMIQAFVSLRAEATEESLKQAVADRLPAYMVPKRLEILKELPLNASGKIDRLALKDLAKERS